MESKRPRFYFVAHIKTPKKILHFEPCRNRPNFDPLELRTKACLVALLSEGVAQVYVYVYV